MDRDEFESALRDFEMQVKKKLPSMINSFLVNKGNREFEASFKHLIETLQRLRKSLLKDVSKAARHEQRIRYFNSVYNMDSQLRSMDNKESLKRHLQFRRHRMTAPIVYDIGEGPENGDLLNVDEEGLLLKTQEKVSVDQEVWVSVSGKKARGKTRWSLVDDSGNVETGVKLVEAPEDFVKEIKRVLKEEV